MRSDPDIDIRCQVGQRTLADGKADNEQRGIPCRCADRFFDQHHVHVGFQAQGDNGIERTDRDAEPHGKQGTKPVGFHIRPHAAVVDNKL